MSISVDTSWENIYKEIKSVNNDYMIQEAPTNHFNEWKDMENINTALEFLKLEFTKDNVLYVNLLGEIIDFSESIKIMIPLLNELLHIDSNKDEYVEKCIEYIKKKTSLSLYNNFNVSFYCYMLKYCRAKLKEANKETILKWKIMSFEKDPGRFGYGFAREEVDRRKNMNEKIDKMLEDIYTTLNITFPAYLNLNSYLNKPTLKAIDFEEVGKMLDELHIETEQKSEWLIQNIKDSDSFEGKRMYSLYKEVIKSFNYLLELDIRINDRLLKKANLTKKYGFFEHRKDLKERNKESQYLASKIEELLRCKL